MWKCSLCCLEFSPIPIQIFTICLISCSSLIYRICSLGLAAQQRNSLEAAIEHNVCTVQTERSGWLRKHDLLRAALSRCFVFVFTALRHVVKVILLSTSGPVVKAVNRVNAYLRKSSVLILIWPRKVPGINLQTNKGRKEVWTLSEKKVFVHFSSLSL